MIGSNNTFGHSFGPDPAEPSARRVRAADAHKEALDRIPASLSGWKDRLTAPAIGVLAAVERANRAAGGACEVHRADIASAVGITPDGVERILARLVEIGAVESASRLKQAPLLRAVAEPPASAPIIAQKAQRAPAADPIRKVAGVTDDKLKAGLVGLRNHEEPPKVDLRDGIVGVNPRR